MNARRQRLLDAMAAAKNVAKELIQVLYETDCTPDGYIEDAHGGRYAIDHPRLYGWMPAPEPLAERME